jgi:hypothetical protein
LRIEPHADRGPAGRTYGAIQDRHRPILFAHHRSHEGGRIFSAPPGRVRSKNHATDKAIVLGLAGEVPDSLDPDYAERRFAEIKASQSLTLPDGREIPFDPAHDIVFDYFQTFDRHPNAMRFEAFDDAGHTVSSEVWFSIGGGFAVGDGEADPGANAGAAVPYMYTSAEDLLRLGEESGLSIAEMALANEADRRPMDEHRPGDVCLHRSRIVHWRNASRQSARSAAGEGNLLAPSGRSRTRAQRAQ